MYRKSSVVADGHQAAVAMIYPASRLIPADRPEGISEALRLWNVTLDRFPMLKTVTSSKSEALRLALTRLYQRMVLWGFDPRRTIAAVCGSRVVLRERRDFVKQGRASGDMKVFPLARFYPIYEDRYAEGGGASGHYFHQDLIVAREIHRRSPERHIDVGSSVYGFVSHVASFREIEVMDVRPITASVSGITFIQQDVMDLDVAYHAVADSVSCLHALEHFGLGRYGDPVDYDGWRKGLAGLTALLRPGGTLYLSVPTGAYQRIEFNAHRVFSLPYIRDVLAEDFRIQHLAFITDQGDLIPAVDPYGPEAGDSFGATYGCSIWTLRMEAGSSVKLVSRV